MKKNKIVCFPLCLVMMLFSYTTAFADSKAEMHLNASPGNTDGIAVVTLSLETKGTPAMMQFCLDFDPNAAECVSASCGEAFSDSSAPTINVSDGKIYFVWDSLTPLEKGGVLLQMEFRCSEETVVGLDAGQDIILADDTFNEIPLAVEAESVLISPDMAGSEAEQPQGAAVQSIGRNRGLTMSESELTLDPGEDGALTVAESGEPLIWSSSNEQVATVENGRVAALENGSAIITATTEDGQREATCYVTVGEADTGQTEASKASAKPLLWAGGIAGAALILLICFRRKKTKA